MNESITKSEKKIRFNFFKKSNVQRRLPAEEGVWLFVIGDMLVFSIFFMVFMYYRNLDIVTFTESQATLNQNLGALNTLLLLTSSWFVALALHSARKNHAKTTSRLFMSAIFCGIGFVVVKYFEYGEKIQAGMILTTNDFYMYYYIFTGVHLLHLLLGLLVLVFLWFKARAGLNGTFKSNDIQAFEGGATYWHMVDLLWIVLFPLIYLLK